MSDQWSFPFAPPAQQIPTTENHREPLRYPSFEERFFNEQMLLPIWDMCCDQCGEPISEGEEAVEIFLGVAGRGEKSGRPMIVESTFIDYATANLHPWCVMEFSMHHIYEDELEDEPVFCEKCGIEVEGNSDD